MTHSELVERAKRWLKNSKGCTVVAGEVVAGMETADAIGWHTRFSTLVECKTSLSDFYSDQRKYFRKVPESGMGAYRYYLCEKGLIDPERHTLPKGWGLLYVCGKIIRRIKESECFHVEQETSLRRERELLVSICRRLCTNDETITNKILVEPESIGDLCA